MRIAPVLAKDLEEINALILRSKDHWNYGETQINHWKAELHISENYLAINRVFKLVDTNANLLGMYAFYREMAQVARLDFFFIDPQYVGKGFGAMMLRDVLSTIKSMAFTSIIVDADPNAKAFYEKFGFKILEEKSSSIPNRKIPVMGRDL